MNKSNLNNSSSRPLLLNLITNKQIEKLEKRDRNSFAKLMLYEDVCSKNIQQSDIKIGVKKKKFADCFFPIRLDNGIMNSVNIIVKNKYKKLYWRNCILLGLENLGNHSDVANKINEINGIMRWMISSNFDILGLLA